MGVTRLPEGPGVHRRLGASASEEERTWRGDKEGGYPSKGNSMSKGGAGRVPVAWGGDAKWGACPGWGVTSARRPHWCSANTRQAAHAALAWVR